MQSRQPINGFEKRARAAIAKEALPQSIVWLAGFSCLTAFLLCASIAQAANITIPQRLIDNHRATMGCWLADIDDDELSEKAIFIDLGVQKLYGFICSSSLSGDSYRLFQVEDGRDEWANLMSFPQLDTKLGWYATSQLQKPTWDEKKKLLRSEIPKQGSASSCRQFSIYSWQKDRFFIAQIGLAGDCKEKEDADKDLIIYPFVAEVEEGKASGTATGDKTEATTDKNADKDAKSKKK
nr:hypothetical protein [uncultured Cohaesibacter sp.]